MLAHTWVPEPSAPDHLRLGEESLESPLHPGYPSALNKGRLASRSFSHHSPKFHPHAYLKLWSREAHVLFQWKDKSSGGLQIKARGKGGFLLRIDLVTGSEHT